MPAPLDGIKILDFTRFQNGPHATVMLSDLGADVLKVERPGDGDPGRALGRQPDGFCSYFEALDRGKRSITLDLGSDEGRAIAYKLAEDADVITENFRPGVMDRLQLGYEDFRKVNPMVAEGAVGAARLVRCRRAGHVGRDGDAGRRAGRGAGAHRVGAGGSGRQHDLRLRDPRRDHRA
jgi:hypothetical protein